MSHSAPGPRDPAVEALQPGQTVTITTETGYLTGELVAGDLGALLIGNVHVRYADGTTAPGVHGIVHLIDTPGLYDRIPEDVYHTGLNTPTPSLSNSSMADLLGLRTPAHFRYNRDHPSGARRVFDIGRAAHARVLGIGEEMASCPAEYLSINGQMSTTKAKAWCAEQRAQGVVPLRPDDYALVRDMANALADHPHASEVLTAPGMRPEVSAYGIDPVTGVWLRGRFDVLDAAIFDYKTAACAHPEAFRKSAWTYGYHRQDCLYSLLHELATGQPAEADRLTFIVQEKTPPYLVSLVQLDDEFAAHASQQVRQAIDLYAECLATDTWPGYPAGVVTVSPPTYATRDAGMAAAADVLDDLERILAE